MSVYRGDVAAGFLTLDTLRRLQKDLQPNRIMILGKSRPLGDWQISARKDVPNFVKNKIRKILATGQP
jgi:ABC-type phosphate/phosphonate transport system substrate-binding protein